jgi:hypothetical protein
MVFEVIDVNLHSFKKKGCADFVKLRVDPPGSLIGIGNFSRGFFLSSNVETIISEYVLLADGNTCYACELIKNLKGVSELFSYNGSVGSCSFVSAEVVKPVPSEVVYHKYSEPVSKSSNYYPYLSELYYFAETSVNTLVSPKMVKFHGGTHFGTRVKFENCLEW